LWLDITFLSLNGIIMVNLEDFIGTLENAI